MHLGRSRHFWMPSASRGKCWRKEQEGGGPRDVRAESAPIRLSPWVTAGARRWVWCTSHSARHIQSTTMTTLLRMAANIHWALTTCQARPGNRGSG